MQGQDENKPVGLRSWIDAFLTVSLFKKIVLANVVVSVALVGATWFISLRASGSPALAAALTASAFVVSMVVHLVLIGRALEPIHSLQRTAKAVEMGDSSARAAASRSADPQVRTLVHLVNQMIETQEDARVSERRRAGRTIRRLDQDSSRWSAALYDELAQTLAGVLLRIRVFKRRLDTIETDGEIANPDENALPLLGEIHGQVKESLELTQRLARRLHPPELRELGLGHAVAALGRSLETPGTVIVVPPTPDLPRVAPEIELALFRITEEALRNAVKHAEARHVWVTLHHDHHEMSVSIRDDGQGFDTSRLENDTPPGLGLSEVFERAAQLGGTIDLTSRHGHGTGLTVSIPLTENGAEAPPGLLEGATP